MMKKLFTTLVVTLITTITFSQTEVKTPFSNKITNSQKYGLEVVDGLNDVLKVVYDDTKFEYNTYEGQKMTVVTLKKKTDKYVIGEISGNYVFYDIEKQQLHRIDYFMDRYSLYHYGKDYSSMKETSIKMMDMLKEGKTQKDVISHLIKQTEYDF